jgi:hypothetical protein
MRKVGSVAHQSAGLGILTLRICRDNLLERGEVNQLDTPAVEEGVATPLTARDAALQDHVR